MSKLVLVDGSSYLYRAFHALPDLRTKAGEPTGAIRGVLSMLKLIIEKEQPDYFAVVFDAPGKTFRDALYPEYKATRSPMPDDLRPQIPHLHELIRAEGWPLLMIEGVEADDVIGTLARTAEAKGISTLISTGDKDLAQLVSPHVTLMNTMSNEVLDEAGVVAKFGVRADQILDYLTLIGDAVDNVPGIDKVGPKTAAKWLNEYDSLDAIVQSADKITGVVGNNLRAALDWLPKGKQLLTVKCDVPLDVAPEALVRTERAPGLAQLYERFEFKTWLKNMLGGEPAASTPARKTSNDHVRVPDAISVPLAPAHARTYETILTETALETALAEMERAALVCFDTETTSLDPMQAKIVGLSFAWKPWHAIYIPLEHRYPGAPDQIAIDRALAKLRPWYEDETKYKLAQNAKYDQHVLANHGIQLRGLIHDTLLQSYVLESHRPHDMDALALRHLNEKTITFEEVCGKGANQLSFDQVSIERATEYSAEDSDVTLRLHEAMAPTVIADDKLRFVYEQIEMPTREVLFKMERTGVLVDTALLNRLTNDFSLRARDLETRAYELAGQPFNLGSPKQLGEILFKKLGMPVKRKTATGQPSTDEEVLQELANDFPLPKLLLQHRGLTKLVSTYTDKLPRVVNAQTGRIHTTYSQATAVTGRLASNEPNLQNIPVRTVEGRRIREAFIASPGCVLVSADYSQIELRIIAHLSEDPSLLKAFAEGLDIHRATASDIFSVPIEDVTPEQRRYTKAVNFGLIYGMGAFGLATQLGIERAAAQSFIDKYFARYPGVQQYMLSTRESARNVGYVETVFGRRLTLVDIKGGSGPRRQAAERAAINAPMQGTAADLIKLAMIAVQNWIEQENLATRLIMQVHDELILEAPEGELAHVKIKLPALMQGVATMRVPLVADVGVGANWQEAH